MHLHSRPLRTTTLSTHALLLGALTFGVACSGEDAPDASTPDAGTPDSGASTNNNNLQDSGVELTLYQRLGEAAGIQTVIEDFVGRVVADPAINGYFLNANVSGSRVVTCLVKQVGALTGGPQTYPAEGEGPDADGCRNMTDAHAGMGVSAQDYGDLAGHLVAALSDAGVAQADIDVLAGALTDPAFVATIVEDTSDDATVYQRVGRKPAIKVVVDDFVGRVVADPEINGFFTATDAARLTTCLVRQVCSIDGPCRYGEGVEPELGNMPCRDMVSSHANMVDDQGNGISLQDFNALAGHLVAALDGAGVSTADRDAIVGAIAPLCGDIIADPTQCPQ